MLWTKVKSEAARGDGGRGFAGLPRVVSDELKEASEQGGAAIWAERGGGRPAWWEQSGWETQGLDPRRDSEGAACLLGVCGHWCRGGETEQ